jgi:isocitrate dehydrogenase (NAD+)
MPTDSSKRVTLIRGDGVGPELAEAAKRCIDALGVGICWEILDAGTEVMKTEGTPLPNRVIDSIRTNRVGLKAPVTTPLGSGFRSVNVGLRQELDLYACVRPCKYYRGVNSTLKNPEAVDIVLVRENTEDLYSGIEFDAGEAETSRIIDEIGSVTGKPIRAGSALSIKPISRFGSERIVRFAFSYAREHKRTKVTAVTKSNIMKSTDGLFHRVAEEVAADYPEIAFEHKLIDNMCMQLVQKPERYDVLVLPNLYGDIISDLCAGLVGGLGLAPGANIGDSCAVCEATHGSAPQYAGMNKANPAALILSGVLLLDHMGEAEAAERLERAVAAVIAEGKQVTYDLKPLHAQDSAVGTQEMAEEIITRIRRG